MHTYAPDRSAETSQYWIDVRDVQQKLLESHPGTDCVYITSVENRRSRMTGGRVTDATIRVAAERIADGTHRSSTPEEIAAYHQEREKEIARLKEIEEARKNTTSLKPSAEQTEQMATVVASAVSAAIASQKGNRGRNEESK